MIRVTVELVSAVSRERDRVLGVMEIGNEGPATGNETRYCRYVVRLSKWAPKLDEIWRRSLFALPPGETIEAQVASFDREQRGPWDLLYRALQAAVGDRNPDARRRS